ncbi:MAG: DUF411 domain-containing protein [Gammaproteobacteria bacterium]|nr:DUF411 domain-containing protein [Gammaproteobacteria bacterium]
MSYTSLHRLLLSLLSGLLLLSPLTQAENSAQLKTEEILVYKSPTCGCCTAWTKYLEDNGFTVKWRDLDNLDRIKTQYGVTPELASCHTAVIDGYVIEGHVPAGDIRRLLLERPAVKGLSVPGMPPLSPGMSDGEPKHFDVLTFDAAGHTTVFSSY